MKKLYPLLLLVLLSSCDVETKNGEIPAEYLSMAKAYQGTFAAKIEDMSGEVTLKLKGNKPVVTLKGFHSGDLLGEACKSKVGNLEYVNINKSKKTDKQYIKTAVFTFEPGACEDSLNGDYHKLVFKYNFDGQYPSIKKVELQSFSTTDLSDDFGPSFPNDWNICDFKDCSNL